MLQVFTDKISLKDFITGVKKNKKTLGFVPTMGALHDGHLSLIQQASNECDIVICSIFVNPTQFNEKEDYDRYPRIPEKDIDLLKNTSCSCIFVPSREEIYEQENYDLIQIDLGELDNILEGKFRPGHFSGVVTVVKKLFDIIEPDKAYFGQKDYQQLLTIRKMAAAFNLPVSIISCPIIREKDGLAMSSRNLLLSDEERKFAPTIYKCLEEAKDKLKIQTIDAVQHWAREELKKSKLVEFEYFEIRDARDLSKIEQLQTGMKIVIVTALRVGKIRLIDNIVINLN
ncbi:pantoate--beta-alanine ligase [Bacteroidota bacterium]